MIDKLFRLLNKPVLWQRSAEPFWDDEHISKGMLEAHLNPDWDAASRKQSFGEMAFRFHSGEWKDPRPGLWAGTLHKTVFGYGI